MPNTKRFVLLRSVNGSPKDLLAIRLTLEASSAAERLSDASVVVADLSPADLGAVARDKDVILAAEAMPVQLIAPMESDKGPTATEGEWAMDAVGAVQKSYTGEGVTVAVLDTGIDAMHAAFTGVDLVRKNFTNETGDGDSNGHGTHVAGILFGRDVNGQRIGVATGITRAVIAKVLDKNGNGTTDAIAQAMTWAEDNGARIISMSLGFDFPLLARRLQDEYGVPQPAAVSKALELYRANLRLFDAVVNLLSVRASSSGGALVIAAAGNESGRDKSPPFEVSAAPPAAAESCVSVAALGPDAKSANGFSIAHFSNTGASIAAPGVDIWSARLGGGLAAMSGTSMATPHVSGVAAMWLQKMRIQRENKGVITPTDLRTQLCGNARFLKGLDPATVGSGLAVGPKD